MSPAPQGGLEVERYIGSCLISQSSRSSSGKQFNQKSKKSPVDVNVRQLVLNSRDSANHGGGPRYTMPPPMPGEFYSQHGWTGMPLFCMASNGQRRHRKGPGVGNRSPKSYCGVQTKAPKCTIENQDVPESGSRSPLSRLAIHTQGAPLIQAGRYNKLGFNQGGPPPLRVYRGGETAVRRPEAARESKTNQSKEPGSCDSVSVASDESSTNSENSLPRIIKPRKRRKKDRKLPPPQQQQGGSVIKPSDHSSLPLQAAEENKSSVPAASSVKTFVSTGSLKSEESIKQSAEAVFCDEGEPSLVLRPGDDLPPELEQEDGPASTCQCRYCDPAGVIWDVDQRCYSPFLTPPSPTELKMSYAFRGYDLGPALRRSWSEPSSTTMIPQIQPRTRAVSESQTQSQPQQQSLEVSSEIITSPNGHRDIEIKFFSSKPNSASQYKVEE